MCTPENANSCLQHLQKESSAAPREHMKHFPKALHYLGRKRGFQFWFQKSEKEKPWQAALKSAPFRRKPQQQHLLTIIYSQQAILLSNTPFKMCSTFFYQPWVLNLMSPSIRTEASLPRGWLVWGMHKDGQNLKFKLGFFCLTQRKMWQNTVSLLICVRAEDSVFHFSELRLSPWKIIPLTKCS